MHGEDADDRKHGADGGHDHGGEDGFEGVVVLAGLGEGGGSERGGGEDGSDIGFVKVGTHAGHVAHVVTDVVGDGRGVARIVFGNAGFHLADEVGADIRGLGEDAAADAGEERLQRSAHAEGQHGGGDDHQPLGLARRGDEIVQHEEPDRDVKQRQADDHEAHHRTAAEGEAEAGIQRVIGGVGDPRGGVGGGFHAKKTGESGKQTAG